MAGIYGADLGPRDCTDIRAMGYNVSGLYRVYPGSDTRRIETDVYCDFSSWTESWLVRNNQIPVILPQPCSNYLIGRGGALAETMTFNGQGRGFDSRSSRHVGTLGKSFTYSCLCASA